jgi:hypothetical protein
VSGGKLQRFLEQGHGPVRLGITEFLGRAGQQRLQHVFLVFVQRRRPSSAGLVLERRRVAVPQVILDPVVNALPGHPEHARHLRGGPSLVELQDGQRAPQDAGIQGLHELTPQAPSLPPSQIEFAHRLLLLR